MYSSKISSSMTIDNKTGETRLNDIDVKVDGFSDPELLEKTKQDYNNDKESKEKYHAKEWPEEDWYEIYENMMRKLLKWRKISYTK
jgi:hypothetical protein